MPGRQFDGQLPVRSFLFSPSLCHELLLDDIKIVIVGIVFTSLLSVKAYRHHTCHTNAVRSMKSRLSKLATRAWDGDENG
jgi:hypothetical protein